MAENQNTTVLVPLSKGYFAIIDSSDMAIVEKVKWAASIHRSKRTGHIARVYAVGRPTGRRMISMHSFLCGAHSGDIDHKDGDTLNNSRSNLRMATRQQNNANQAKASGRSSIFKGVSFHRQSGKWTAQIVVSGKQKHLGSFLDQVNAAHTYNVAAIESFGEFAKLNDIGGE